VSIESADKSFISRAEKAVSILTAFFNLERACHLRPLGYAVNARYAT